MKIARRRRLNEFHPLWLMQLGSLPEFSFLKPYCPHSTKVETEDHSYEADLVSRN